MKKAIERCLFILRRIFNLYDSIKLSVSDVLSKICLKIAQIPFSVQLAVSPPGITGISWSSAHFEAESLPIILCSAGICCDNFLLVALYFEETEMLIESKKSKMRLNVKRLIFLLLSS